MPTIQVNGTQLAYQEQGQGDPLILVHGTLGDYRSWPLQFERFAQTFRTIAYSRRYHHPNHCADGEADYSAARHAADLAAFLTGLGLESAHVVGNSYGAYTALLLAARHPTRVRRLVLGEPPVFPLLEGILTGKAQRDDFLATVWEPAGELMQHGKLRDGIEHFVDGVVEPETFARFPSEVQALLMDNACEFKAETSSADFWTLFRCEDAAQISTPTLLLSGEQSLKMLQLIVDELVRCLPNAERVMIPDSTHEMPSDNPDAYNQAVEQFLMHAA